MAAEGIEAPFTQAEITALEHTAQGKTPEAIVAWRTAFSAASDDTDTLLAARSLAELGAPVPDLGDLERDHPELVREIRVVQQATTAGGEGLEALRTGASESLSLTLMLAERHGSRGEWRMAADILSAGAERWGHPLMMLMAARRYNEAGDLEMARRTAESALAMGGPGWAGQLGARALLFDVLNASGDWEQATQQARVLVTLDQYDLRARWALVHSLVRRGDLEAAWNALTPEGDPVSPQDRHDAMTWIGLTARYDKSPQFVSRALATMDRWSDDEQLTGIFIGQLYTGLRREELTPSTEDLAALHSATAEYTERFPHSTVFRKVEIPNDDPLAPLIPDLRARYEALEQIVTKVRDGHLPLGILAEAAGGSYAEASLQRAAGFVRCHDPARDAQGWAALAATLDKPVVLDTTAAHTLALLDASTRSHLLAVFGQIVATDPAYRDALHGHESLGLRSAMSTEWDPSTGQPRVRIIDESVAEALADHAGQMCAILRGAARRPWPHLKVLKDLPGRSDWLASLDMAAAEGLPYWCDDGVLRTLATGVGVATFDTVDLLRYLTAEGRLKRDLLTVAEATLLCNYYADLGYDRATFDLSATMDGWRPRGAAFAITRQGSWTNPDSVVEFLFAAVRQCDGLALDDLEGWIAAAALGLVRIAPDEDAAGANLQILLRQCLAQSWMRPDRLFVVLHAIRVALKERPGTVDPVAPVLAETYRSLVVQYGHALAAPLLMGLVQFAPEEDRRTTARVVLTYRS